MQHIYVVRHGQSTDNAQQIVSGQRNPLLSTLGTHQADQAGAHTAGLGIDYIVCSPLTRAQQTATRIAQAIDYPQDKIIIIGALEERNLGELEGTSYAQNERMNGNYRETEKTPGVEPLEKLRVRVHGVLHELLRNPHKNILVVCHQNIGRMFMVIAKNEPSLQLYDQPRLENGKIYQLL